MQYHGIASYKFEYQLSTGGDWTTAVDTPNTSTSYAYTIEELTSGTGYNLRATVKDNAGNLGVVTKIITTKKSDKNPGGNINNIVSDDIIYPNSSSGLNTENTGKTVAYVFKPTTVTFSSLLSGGQTSYTSTNNFTWRILAENTQYFFLVRSCN